MKNLDNRGVFIIFAAIAVFGAAISCIAVILAGKPSPLESVASFGLNIATEALGALAAFWLIGVILETRRRKEILKLQLGSASPYVAEQAIKELRLEGWLQNGTLKGIQLTDANLDEQDLTLADLTEAILNDANLSDARLYKAILVDAKLRVAHLRGADFTEASLQRASFFRAHVVQVKFYEAKLQGASFVLAHLDAAKFAGADLRGVDFLDADLGDASFEDEIFGPAQFDENTTFPDDSKWKPGIDLDRYTNPAHEEFWRSDKRGTPAYPGDDD